MNDAVLKTLKQKDYIVKSFLFKIASELKLSTPEVLLLIYFLNQDRPSFDIEKIKSELFLDEEEIKGAYSKLITINLISTTTEKTNGIIDEIINLDNIYKDVSTDIVLLSKEESDNNLFELFESEFGRTLSPMEYEIINNWLEETSEELIEEALRESIYNGVKSLRYIEKILLTWKDKGYKTVSDVHKAIKKETKSNVLVDLLEDYDWINDESK